MTNFQQFEVKFDPRPFSQRAVLDQSDTSCTGEFSRQSTTYELWMSSVSVVSFKSLLTLEI